MIRSIHTLFLVAVATALMAQSYVHQVVVLNEGYFDMGTQTQVEPVTLGTYDPATATYQSVATIPNARFASDVEVSDDAIYVAADAQLLKYDRDTYQLLAQTPVVGIRKIALWNGNVLITRGELGGLPHYFEVRNASDLSLNYFLDTNNGPAYSCEDVEVVGNTAFLAVSNAFDWANLVGKVGQVDLLAQSYTGEVDLGPDGLNPENIMVASGAIYVLNNKDFTGSSISKLTNGATVVDYTDNIAMNSGCGASVFAEEKIYYQEYSVNQLARFDVTTATVLDTLNTIAFYGLEHDPVNDLIYATSTDFVSTGTLHILAFDGTELSQLPVDVAPGNMAMDIRSSVGVNELSGTQITLSPNPASDVLVVKGIAKASIQLVDALGREVNVSSQRTGDQVVMNIKGLPSGNYHVRVGDEVHAVVIAR